jgi:hypothetical protein
MSEQDTAGSEADRGNDRRATGHGRKRYEAPRLVDYGRIAKLTQSGGITTKDFGNMERVGP